MHALVDISPLNTGTVRGSDELSSTREHPPLTQVPLRREPVDSSAKLEEQPPLIGELLSTVVVSSERPLVPVETSVLAMPNTPPSLPLETLRKIGVPPTLKPLEEGWKGVGGSGRTYTGTKVKPDPTELKNLNTAIQRYNEQVSRLSSELTALKKLEDLGTSPEKVTQRIHDANSAITSLSEALEQITQKQRLLAELADSEESDFALSEKQQKEFAEVGAMVSDIAEQATQLKSSVKTIEKLEQGSRGEWRTAIAELKREVATKAPSQSGKVTTSDLVWLHQLKNELVKTNNNLPKALEQLMHSGVAFPKLDVTLALLAGLYPQTGIIPSTDSPLQTVSSLRHDQSTSVGDEDTSFDQYQELVDQHTALKKRSADTLHYLNILRETSANVLKALPKDIDTLQNSRVYRQAKVQQDKALVALKSYYTLDQRQANEKLTEKELSTYQSMINRVDNGEVRGALTQIVKLTQYRETVYEENERVDDGHLSLIAGTSGLFVKRDQLVLDEEDFDLEGLLLHGEALTQFRTVEEDSDSTDLMRLRLHARECMQAEHRLGYYSTGKNGIGEYNHGFDSEVDFSKASESLFRDFRAHPKQYMEFLTKRSELLADYTDKLTQLIAELPAEGAEDLVRPLQASLDNAQAERIMLNHLFSISEGVVPLERLQQALESQQALKQKLDEAISTAKRPLDGEFAQLNLEIYQLRSKVLQKNIKQTEELTKEQRELNKEIALTVDELRATFGLEEQQGLSFDQQLEDELKLHPELVDLPLLAGYRELQEQQQTNHNTLERLNTEFRAGMLTLQQEELRAKDAGGYPEGVTWSAWAQSKLPAQSWWSSNYRQTPQELLLNRQLALQGISMSEAYAALGSTLTGATSSSPTETLAKLGFTPSQLQAWTAGYPAEARLLAGNLNHAYNILSSTGNGVGTQVTDMFSTAWNRGSTENLVEDVLLGNRTDLVGAVDPQPMPPAMIALLNMAGWAPYIAGAVQGMKGASLGGSVAIALGGPLGVTGAGLLAMQGLLGAAQTSVEVQFAREVTKHRDAEVMINALLGNTPDAAGATITDRIKTAAQYTMQRQAMRELGTVARDGFEVGKLGAIQRYREEMSLWWQNATPRGKVALVAVAVGTSLAAGAMVAGAALAIVGTGGAALIAVAVLAVLAMGSSSLFTRSLWNFLAPVLGLSETRDKVQKQMNQKRLDGALNEVRAKLDKQLQKQSVELTSSKLTEQGVNGPELEQNVLREGALKEVDTQLKAYLAKLLEEQPGLSDESLAKALQDKLSELSSSDLPSVPDMLAKSRQQWVTKATEQDEFDESGLDVGELTDFAKKVDLQIAKLLVAAPAA